MKKLLLPIFLMFAIVISGFSQVPDAFNYQAVVRNASGELIGNQDVSFKISILQDSESGTAVYVETHFITTNDFGLANLKIGQGTVESGIFFPGGWGLNTHFLKLEIDAEGGSSYSHLGTSQLLSVPYAFHAQTVAEDEVDDADADATNELQTISLSGTELSLSEGGGTVELPENNWGTQAVESNYSLLGDGTTANPLSIVGNLTDDQTLSLSGNDLSISGGNTVALPSNPWLNDNDDIYFNTGKVGIGKIVGSDGVKLQVKAPAYHAIAIENNSVVGTLYAINTGTGPAADFRNKIRIMDGTEGAGKVLTSDASGNSSWQATPIIAYGTINSSGTVATGSGNFTISKTVTGVYTITISGVSYSYVSYVTTATIVGNPGFIKSGSSGGTLVINTYDIDGADADKFFSFIVIKP